MPAGRRSRFVASLFLLGTMVPLAISKDNDPAKQREVQKKIQAQVEEAARRTGSTIDAMLFQRLSASLEQKMLEEVADSLKGLSEEQIKAVLGHLEAALKAPDEATATKEQKEAYTKHRAVIASLRGMLVKLDVVRNLDEAANRLDRAADKQLGVNADTLNGSAQNAGGRVVAKARLEPCLRISGDPSHRLNKLGKRQEAVARIEFLAGRQNAFVMGDSVSKALDILQTPMNGGSWNNGVAESRAKLHAHPERVVIGVAEEIDPKPECQLGDDLAGRRRSSPNPLQPCFGLDDLLLPIRRERRKVIPVRPCIACRQRVMHRIARRDLKSVKKAIQYFREGDVHFI